MPEQLKNAITDIPGIRVGHAQDEEALTGCTVVLCENGAIGGVDQRGGAPGTRETDAMHPMHLVNEVLRVARVPIVPAAILFDLGIGRGDVRPDAEMGYQACLNASAEPPAEGNIGAGTGATVGKILGLGGAMKSGIGTASLEIGSGIIVGAIAAVNVFGDVVDPSTGQIIAGARVLHEGPEKIGRGPYFADTMCVMESLVGRTILGFMSRGNTAIGIVATNAKFDKEQINKVAQMAQDGLARTVKPAHTMLDGDTIFALATGEKKADVNIVGAFAAEVFSQAMLRAVYTAKPAAGLPSAAEVEA
jgi:L-aminopeptidase/D-esterase-like protein